MAGDFIDDFHAAAHTMADELELDGEDRDAFIDGVMERKGYQRVTSWAPPEPAEGEGRGKPLVPARRKPAARGQGGGGQGGQGGRQGSRSPYFGGNNRG
jgi:hypothetical protein